MPREFVSKKRRRSTFVRPTQQPGSFDDGQRPPSSPSSKRRRVVETATGQSSSDIDINASIVIPPRTNYLYSLRHTQRVYQLETGQCIIADCDTSTGQLKTSYVILDKKTFHCSIERKEMNIYLCRCPSGSGQRDRLLPMCDRISTEFYDFYYQETDNQCFHAEAATSVLDDNMNTYTSAASGEEVVLPHVQQLSEEPLLVAVEMESGIELLQKNRSKNIICTCTHGKRQCQHKLKYTEWVLEQSQSILITSELQDNRPTRSVFTCISKNRIKTPLSLEQQELYRNYESGQQSFPVHLIPRIPPNQPDCSHGFQWDAADPVEEGWIVGKATIYKEGCSLTHLEHDGSKHAITVYYRRSSGDCNCKLEYDGYHDLLLNLNNTDMVYYGVLFSYLHHMLEGRNPLAACHRAYSHSHMFLSGTKCIPLHKLRLAWNSFARLLDVDWNTGFLCPQCGDQPRVIVCDGTMLGCRKDLLHRLGHESPTADQTPMAGSRHRDRVFVGDAKTRKLLAQYASKSTPLSPEEYQELVNGVQRLGLTSLMDLLSEQNSGGSHTAPSSVASFLKDIARNGPASSLLQGASSGTVQQLKDLLARDIPIFRNEWCASLRFVQQSFPIIFKLLSKTHVNGYIPVTIQRLVRDILDASSKAFVQSPSSRTYSAPAAEELFQNTGFFPALPRLHRKGTYTMDKAGQDSTCRTQTECRKYANGHPTLSPGIFTIFCPHGVCYGFEVMTRYESPEVPFDIFKTRFNVAPEVIIYDNACRLHAYCLNREPEFFRNSLFLVDRMHWHNHRSCSSGYNIDSYGDLLQLNQINTQVNEQANAGLARIKSQLAYMLPDNFVFHAALYLSFRNDKKKAGLSN